jgi:hypothetical protein
MDMKKHCSEHEKPQEQRLNEMFLSNLQTKNNTRLCDSKTKTRDVQDKRENGYYANICKHEHEKNMTRLWFKIVLKIGVEHTKGNEGSYFYLYAFGNLT